MDVTDTAQRLARADALVLSRFLGTVSALTLPFSQTQPPGSALGLGFLRDSEAVKMVNSHGKVQWKQWLGVFPSRAGGALWQVSVW